MNFPARTMFLLLSPSGPFSKLSELLVPHWVGIRFISSPFNEWNSTVTGLPMTISSLPVPHRSPTRISYTPDTSLGSENQGATYLSPILNEGSSSALKFHASLTFAENALTVSSINPARTENDSDCDLLPA